MNVVICSGGTGGHMFPACALHGAFVKKGHNSIIVTDSRGDVFCSDISKKIVIPTVRFSFKRVYEVIMCECRTFFEFYRLWKKDKPDVIIGFGGILTIVPMLVAKIFGAKLILYEQNAVIGRANKFLSKVSNYRLSHFDCHKGWMRMASPVRKEFLNATKYVYEDKLNILVIGGSQGAKSFSSILPCALSELSLYDRSKIEITQQVNDQQIRGLQNAYEKIGLRAHLRNFISNVAEVMSNSQLIICRAGASTLTELAAIGRPAILIPYPKAADNHQYFNALYFKNKRAAWIFNETKDNIKELSDTIYQILHNKELLKIAASNIIDRSINNATECFVRFVESVKFGDEVMRNE